MKFCMTKSALLLGLLTVNAGALAQLRPPSAPPTSLPPLPSKTPMGTGILPPLPAPQQSTPEQEGGTNNSYEAGQSKEPSMQDRNTVAKYDAEKAHQLLQKEVDRLSKAIPTSLDMRVVFANSQTDVYRQQMALGNIPTTTIVDSEQPVKGTLKMGNALNSNQPNICYVVFDPTRGEQHHYTDWQPMADAGHAQTPYAFAVGRAVGRCLDTLERNTILTRRLQWKAQDTIQLGLLPSAVQQTYGNQFAKAQFLSQPERIFAIPSQQQHTERVVDAFALAWIMKLGAGMPSVEFVVQQKKKLPASSPLHTHSTVEIMSKQGNEISRLNDVALLWNLAKQARAFQGVTQEVMTNTMETVAPDNEIARYIVTPNGLVPVNSKGQPVQQPNRATPINQRRDFNSIKRFGQPPIR